MGKRARLMVYFDDRKYNAKELSKEIFELTKQSQFKMGAGIHSKNTIWFSCNGDVEAITEGIQKIYDKLEIKAITILKH